MNAELETERNEKSTVDSYFNLAEKTPFGKIAYNKYYNKAKKEYQQKIWNGENADLSSLEHKISDINNYKSESKNYISEKLKESDMKSGEIAHIEKFLAHFRKNIKKMETEETFCNNLKKEINSFAAEIQYCNQFIKDYVEKAQAAVFGIDKFLSPEAVESIKNDISKGSFSILSNSLFTTEKIMDREYEEDIIKELVQQNLGTWIYNEYKKRDMLGKKIELNHERNINNAKDYLNLQLDDIISGNASETDVAYGMQAFDDYIETTERDLNNGRIKAFDEDSVKETLENIKEKKVEFEALQTSCRAIKTILEPKTERYLELKSIYNGMKERIYGSLNDLVGKSESLEDQDISLINNKKFYDKEYGKTELSAMLDNIIANNYLK